MPQPQMLSSWHMDSMDFFFWPHTNKTEIWEQGEEIGKVLFIVLLNLFILFSQTDQTVCNFLIFGWVASISKETNNVSFFQTCMIYSQKLKNSTHPSKKHLPKHTWGSKTSNLHLPDLQMWRIFHMICLIRHFQSFTHGSRIDLRRFRPNKGTGPFSKWLGGWVLPGVQI